MPISVFDVEAAVKSGAAVTEANLEQWSAETDPSRAGTFYAGGDAKAAVETICTSFVSKYLNNVNTSEVPIRRKTKFLLVMNNMALFKPVRPSVLEAIKNLDGIFEDSMKQEGKMPFDSELGRMSEHVLVLMMRVLDYKMKAVDVHEFAEHNTQFAVQLLLAVLLKEPPYEFDMRANCIAGLFGFTQPQAFFGASDDKDIKFHECEGFTDKVNFTLDLMLRLGALQVLNDVLVSQMYEHNTIQGTEYMAVANTMRCVMNIFQFSSKGSTQWRQHVLLSTTFIDGATILCIQGQLRALEAILSTNTGSSNIPNDLLAGLALAFKFTAFATYHMGNHSRGLRPLCSFIYNMLNLPVRSASAASSKQLSVVFVHFLHFLCNIDALSGDAGLLDECDELIPELTSSAISVSLAAFFVNQLSGDSIESWHKRFLSADPNALVAQDSATFEAINKLFVEAKTPATKVPAPTAEAPSASTVLADMPTLAKKSKATSEKKKQKKMSIEKAAAAVDHPVTYVKGSTHTGKFACALNGHTMKTPVQSPYGHNFEKETIEEWIKTQGSVCPITGKPLSLSDLKPNKQLQGEIMQEAIRETMKHQTQEDTVDLYDF